MPKFAEHDLQRAVGDFVKAAVTPPHRFACFDRSANDRTGRRHLWEAKRYIRSGEPDTELLVSGHPAIKIELKAGDNKPTDNQWREGAAVEAAGHLWDWTNSVMGYGEILERLSVPLAPNWRLMAAHLDAKLSTENARKPSPKRDRQMRGKPSAGEIKRMEKVRGRVMF